MVTHVCLIDDDPDELDIFMEALGRIDAACRCTSAQSGGQALEMLDYILPDLIFLDLNMPGMSGLECLAEIRKNPRLARVPVVIYSTGLTNASTARALALGATACLRKTTDIGSLVDELSPFIGHETAPNDFIH